MRATEILMSEHEVIERVLDAEESIIRKVRGGGAVPPDRLVEIVRFFREYADGFHHHKEEKLLFPALEESGLPCHGGPIGVMLEEHVIGRSLIAAMAEAAARAAAGDPGAFGAWAEAAEEHSMLLRSHIQKENGVLFRIAERILDPETQRRLGEEFEAFARAAAIDDLLAAVEGLATALEEACPCAIPEIAVQVLTALRRVVDRDLGIDVIDLGMIYGVETSPAGVCITMIAETPGYPLGGDLADDVEAAVRRALPEVPTVAVVLVEDPPWSPERLSNEAPTRLGM